MWHSENFWYDDGAILNITKISFLLERLICTVIILHLNLSATKSDIHLSYGGQTHGSGTASSNDYVTEMKVSENKSI